MSRKASAFPDKKEYLARVAKMLTYVATDVLLKNTIHTSMEDVKKSVEGSKELGPDHVSLRDWETYTDKVEETQTAFFELTKMVCDQKDIEKLVICVDNLDRCSPENVVHLLESVKNFLSIPGCIWVFAMDSGVVASYINHKYEGTIMDGNSYLDKIIPEQFHLSLTPSKGEDHIARLIYATGGDPLSLDITRLPLLPRVLVPRRLIKSARKLKAFSELNQKEISYNTIFALTLLYHSWPEFYERLSSPEEMHIGGILANFFRNNEHASWGSFKALPMDKSFTNDQELTYFLQKSFPDYESEEHIPTLTQEIMFAIEGLRLIGLP